MLETLKNGRPAGAVGDMAAAAAADSTVVPVVDEVLKSALLGDTLRGGGGGAVPERATGNGGGDLFTRPAAAVGEGGSLIGLSATSCALISCTRCAMDSSQARLCSVMKASVSRSSLRTWIDEEGRWMERRRSPTGL